MNRLLGTASLLVTVALALAGCAGGGAASAYSPYDFQANPYCGVYGTCEAGPARRFQPYDFAGH